jgi:hypothetical protein
MANLRSGTSVNPNKSGFCGGKMTTIVKARSVLNPYEPPTQILKVPSPQPLVTLSITRKPLFFPETEAEGYILEDGGGVVPNKESLYLFEHIIQFPVVVFDQFDQKFCYCGVTGSVIIHGGVISLPPVAEVGVVFARYDSRSKMIKVNRVAAYLMSSECPGYPNHWKDIGPKIWPV